MIDAYLARKTLETVAAALDTARQGLERLAANGCLSGEVRLELEEAAQHIREAWCDDARAAAASGLVAEVDEELKHAERLQERTEQ